MDFHVLAVAGTNDAFRALKKGAQVFEESRVVDVDVQGRRCARSCRNGSHISLSSQVEGCQGPKPFWATCVNLARRQFEAARLAVVGLLARVEAARRARLGGSLIA